MIVRDNMAVQVAGWFWILLLDLSVGQAFLLSVPVGKSEDMKSSSFQVK